MAKAFHLWEVVEPWGLQVQMMVGAQRIKVPKESILIGLEEPLA